MSSDLPPDLEVVSRVIDSQPPQARELFRYAIAMLLVEDKKAQIVATQTIDARKHIFVRTVAGELFSVVKPDVSEKSLERMKQMAKEILATDPLDNGVP